MSRPLLSLIGAVFIPVSDLQRAIGAYRQLPSLPLAPAAHEKKNHDLLLSGEIALIFQGHKFVTIPRASLLLLEA